MFSFRTCQAILLGAFLTAAPAMAARTHRAATSGHARHHYYYRHRYYHHYRRREIRGQRGIEPQRAAQIQEALIKAHYLTGSASGVWDAATQSAMQKYQADHGWQTKLVPDSRALIALGLGPKDDKAPPAGTGIVGVPGNAGSAGSGGGPTDASLPAPLPGTLADTHSLPN